MEPHGPENNPLVTDQHIHFFQMFGYLAFPGLIKDCIDAIIEASRSPGEGAIGDGKIFVTPIEDLVRVRTGERGDSAL